MSLFDDIEAFVAGFAAARETPAIAELLGEAAKCFGFDYFGIAHVERSGQLAPPVHLTNYPEHWVEQVQADGMFIHDPVLMASERAAAAFAWNKLPGMIALTTEQRRFMADAQRVGLGEGFSVPLHIPGEASGLCSFVTRDNRELPRANLPAAQYLSCFAFEALRARAIGLNDASDAQPRLTQRQMDCMVLIARGKSDWIAGKLLGLSPETVKTHVDNAKKRFGVASRTELVVRALFYGQLSFHDVLRSTIPR